MATTRNAMLGGTNLADAGTVTTGSAQPLLPATRLQDEHVGRIWRGTGSSDHILVDLGAACTFRAVGLLGTNFTATATKRVRASLLDTSGLLGEAYDTGTVSADVDKRVRQTITVAPADITARYVRIDVADPAVTGLQAGRLLVMPLNQVTWNFSYDWTSQVNDLSTVTRSRSGAQHVDRRPSFRSLEMMFAFLTEGEAKGWVREMDWDNGKHTDVLLIQDPKGAVNSEAIFGLMTDVTGIQNPFHDGYRKNYRIEERL